MKKIVFTALLLLPVLGTAQKNTTTEFDSTFAHSVYFWLKQPESVEDRAQFEAALQKFLDTSKYAKTNFLGIPPKAVREVVDDSFTYNLIVTFESAAAQQAYQEEKAHLVFIEECKDLWQRVVVYDALGIAP
ncbi:MAG: Dabb family protein [Bacteroidota bacterium]